VALTHEQHRRDREPEDAPDVMRVLDPEEGPPVEQHVAQRAAAERGQPGDDHHADGVEPLARGLHQPRQRESQRGGEFDRPQRGGQVQRERLHRGLGIQ